MKDNLIIRVEYCQTDVFIDSQYLRIGNYFYLTSFKDNRPIKISDVVVYSKQLGLI